MLRGLFYLEKKFIFWVVFMMLMGILMWRLNRNIKLCLFGMCLIVVFNVNVL